MALPVVNVIWIGETMGSIHAACLKSFLITGHTVVLHAYGRVSDAPAGVRYADAGMLRPKDKLLRYANGSASLSSNLMRYELQRQGLGLYVDADVFCLRPFEDADLIFGEEDEYGLNGAVLKLPQSPLLDDLCAIGEGWTPPWADVLAADGSVPPLSEMPWGTTGPRALTHYAQVHGWDKYAAPYDVFYPVHFSRWRQFYDTGLRLADIVTPRTRYVHFYAAASEGIAPKGIPPNSPLGELMAMVERG